MSLRNMMVAFTAIAIGACGGGGSNKNSSGDPQSSPEGVDAQFHRLPPGMTMPVTLPVSGIPGTTPVTLPGTTPVTLPGTTPVTLPGTTPVTLPGTTPVTPPTTTPVTQTSFQSLPLLNDADGNPNDASATYNLTADANVPVRVVTPTGTWTTPMMRYNNSQLPPVIKAKRGTTITVNLQNNLGEVTTIHWHGFKIPAAQDGGPDMPVLAGASRTYSFQIGQPGAPLWFHPHAWATTATQVYNGLAGAFIVTDDITDGLEATKQLPSGNADVALLIQDRSFGPDNGAGVRQLAYSATGMFGMLGDTVLVNGVVQPTLNVDTRQYRLRLYNGSNARIYDFALSSGATFRVVGTDGGLLPAPVTVSNVVLSPGERAEIVVDFRTAAVNTGVALVNRSTANSVIMNFNVAAAATDDVNLYTALPANAEIYARTPTVGAAARTFVLNTVGMMGPFAINGKVFNPAAPPDFVSTSGATEVWTITNQTMMVAHPFHAHAIQWQVVDRNGVPASGADLGWKDTVLVQSGETVRIVGRYDPVVNKGLYSYHCHILEHEEAGMMGSFFIQ